MNLHFGVHKFSDNYLHKAISATHNFPGGRRPGPKAGVDRRQFLFYFNNLRSLLSLSNIPI